MNNIVREKLVEIIKNHGIFQCHETKKCKAFLNDYCGSYKKEISAILCVLEEGGVNTLLSSDKKDVALLNKIVSNICRNNAMAVNAVEWAVDAWALALGFENPVKPEEYVNFKEPYKFATSISNHSNFSPSSYNNNTNQKNPINIQKSSPKVSVEKNVVKSSTISNSNISTTNKIQPHNYKKAFEYYNKGNYIEAINLFIVSAQKGHANAQYNLGVMFANAKGVQRDEIEAVYWYKKAAVQGFANAQYNLGLMYANGTGAKKDLLEAVYWYKKAAEQGHSNAQYNLGVMYANGTGVKQDYTTALSWYKKAAQQGYAIAQYNIGVLYHKGCGIKQDYSEAMFWYRKAAENGYAGAQYNIGVLYAKGNGVSKNLQKAKEWYQKAAQQGYKLATKSLDNWKFWFVYE